ncbi:thioredoxin family protein [Flavobacterium sp. Fl-77]|uniref:Thioredoxin family protein n=1 Tax=Flavobacterium flavipigmentatum TaxID=2893884 RepID=A0AAJ2SG59_9FLAO|nr:MULTISPECIES: thioredoxin family protein [unclassified Flavobacterium]MDX6182423.1 thioredoxin family protein [Flavobacterium sp. Fl-33]MDX6185664.1 thioredoxin family protein [Flavobacterium sp. Fl-77]UFH38849.1 thioredoxin family protein [Flavobacterium sp. F-70]
MKATLYHDGCKICSEVGQDIVNLIGLTNLDITHVGLHPEKEEEAKLKGVKVFPALVLSNGNVLHFNVLEHEGNIECLL